MGLQSSFQSVSEAARTLQDQLDALQLTVTEDKPLSGAPMLVDNLGYVLLDLRALAGELLANGDRGKACLESNFDLGIARRSLIDCQGTFQEIGRRLTEDLLSFERMADLTNLGVKRRGEWLAWSRSVKEGLDGLRLPVHDVSEALFQCWQDMTEKAAGGISILTTNVGQQIKLDWQAEGLRERVKPAQEK